MSEDEDYFASTETPNEPFTVGDFRKHGCLYFIIGGFAGIAFTTLVILMFRFA